VLHVLFNENGVAPWVLTEEEFLNRIETLEATHFARAPLGRVSVEAFDELDRVQWRAYYPDVAALVILARHFREGRGKT